MILESNKYKFDTRCETTILLLTLLVCDFNDLTYIQRDSIYFRRFKNNMNFIYCLKIKKSTCFGHLNIWASLIYAFVLFLKLQELSRYVFHSLTLILYSNERLLMFKVRLYFFILMFCVNFRILSLCRFRNNNI